MRKRPTQRNRNCPDINGGEIKELPTALQVKAKEKPDYRFYLLYDKVYREDVLAYAYQRCKATCRGHHLKSRGETHSSGRRLLPREFHL
jgi:hypothetical protein